MREISELSVTPNFIPVSSEYRLNSTADLMAINEKF